VRIVVIGVFRALLISCKRKKFKATMVSPLQRKISSFEQFSHANLVAPPVPSGLFSFMTLTPLEFQKLVEKTNSILSVNIPVEISISFNPNFTIQLTKY
jgi:hypothetical protein